MARFGDIDEYFKPGLELTVRGWVYTVPLPSATVGLWCQRIVQLAPALMAAGDADPDEARAVAERFVATPPPPGYEGLTMPEIVLGKPLHDQMVTDDLPYPYIQHCAQTALVWIVGGETEAARYWESGGLPQPVSPANRQERRATKTAAGSSSRTTSTGGAATTRSRASGSGTTTRRSARPVTDRRSPGKIS